jgi:hypothetical protein
MSDATAEKPSNSIRRFNVPGRGATRYNTAGRDGDGRATVTLSAAFPLSPCQRAALVRASRSASVRNLV